MRYLLTILCFVAIVATAQPKRAYNNAKTDYAWYSDKYSDDWVLTDSSTYLLDTVYLYKVCGLSFKFNQNGKLLTN